MCQDDRQLENFIIDNYNNVYLSFQNGNYVSELINKKINRLKIELKISLDQKTIILFNKLMSISEFKSDIERQFMFVNGLKNGINAIEYVDMEYIDTEYINSEMVKREIEKIIDNYVEQE